MDKVYVDDWGQCKGGRFGALRAHVEAGLVTGESIAGELGDVVAGTRAGRESRRRADPVLAPRPRDDRHRARPGDPRPRGRAGRRHAAALPMIVLGDARPRALPPDRRRRASRSRSTRPRSRASRPRARGCSPTSTRAGAPTGSTTGRRRPRRHRAGRRTRQRAFQRALLARGAGTGPPLAPEVVRGALLLRLAGFLDGAAGVSPALCAFLADRLNDGWSPVVPSHGHLQRRRGRRAQPPLRDAGGGGGGARGRRAGPRRPRRSRGAASRPTSPASRRGSRSSTARRSPRR